MDVTYIIIPLVTMFFVLVPAVVIERPFHIFFYHDDVTPIETILSIMGFAGILLAITLQT